jgi:hypothetical protein
VFIRVHPWSNFLDENPLIRLRLESQGVALARRALLKLSLFAHRQAGGLIFSSKTLFSGCFEVFKPFHELI